MVKVNLPLFMHHKLEKKRREYIRELATIFYFSNIKEVKCINEGRDKEKLKLTIELTTKQGGLAVKGVKSQESGREGYEITYNFAGYKLEDARNSPSLLLESPFHTSALELDSLDKIICKESENSITAVLRTNNIDGERTSLLIVYNTPCEKKDKHCSFATLVTLRRENSERSGLLGEELLLILITRDEEICKELSKCKNEYGVYDKGTKVEVEVKGKKIDDVFVSRSNFYPAVVVENFPSDVTVYPIDAILPLNVDSKGVDLGNLSFTKISVVLSRTTVASSVSFETRMRKFYTSPIPASSLGSIPIEEEPSQPFSDFFYAPSARAINTEALVIHVPDLRELYLKLTNVFWNALKDAAHDKKVNVEVDGWKLDVKAILKAMIHPASPLGYLYYWLYPIGLQKPETLLEYMKYSNFRTPREVLKLTFLIRRRDMIYKLDHFIKTAINRIANHEDHYTALFKAYLETLVWKEDVRTYFKNYGGIIASNLAYAVIENGLHGLSHAISNTLEAMLYIGSSLTSAFTEFIQISLPPDEVNFLPFALRDYDKRFYGTITNGFLMRLKSDSGKFDASIVLTPPSEHQLISLTEEDVKEAVKVKLKSMMEHHCYEEWLRQRRLVLNSVKLMGDAKFKKLVKVMGKIFIGEDVNDVKGVRERLSLPYFMLSELERVRWEIIRKLEKEGVGDAPSYFGRNWSRAYGLTNPHCFDGCKGCVGRDFLKCGVIDPELSMLTTSRDATLLIAKYVGLI